MRIRKAKAGAKKSPGLAPHRRTNKSKPSVMRQSTWENMTKGQRLKEYGTTSYKKYKEGKMAARGKRQRGGGGGSDQGAGPGGFGGSTRGDPMM